MRKHFSCVFKSIVASQGQQTSKHGKSDGKKSSQLRLSGRVAQAEALARVHLRILVDPSA
jgi:hypothetical protein